MASQITNYQCPACTGPLHFVGSSGMLECDYCGSQYAVADIEALYAEKESAAAQASAEAAEQPKEEWDYEDLKDEWGGDLKTYSCPSCGAELICEGTTAATSCPYCGNPTVVPGQFSGALKPDFIIPFKLDKDSAVAALKEHYKKKFFLPKAFRAGNHIEEIQGLYVPFWMYDCVADADIRYECTRSETHTEGDYEVTRTDHFMAHRAGTVSMEKIPADSSRKMDDALMDSVEPFDYADLTAFSTAYLPGYLADKYDVSAEEDAARADLRAENTAADCMRDTVRGYETVTELPGREIDLQRGKVHYALLPVWILNTKWKDQLYTFAMNGQTGKLVGNLPVSKAKFWGTFAAIAAVSMIICSRVALAVIF